jgi:hypothetical protein
MAGTDPDNPDHIYHFRRSRQPATPPVRIIRD